MAKKKSPVACYCESYCLTCEIGFTTREAVHVHNLRVACHGERAYPVGGKWKQREGYYITRSEG